MRVAVDASPLAYRPWTGVARALITHLRALAARDDRPELVVCLPQDAVEGVRVAIEAWNHGAGKSRAPARILSVAVRPGDGLAWRRLLPLALQREAVDVFLSPWSAFPDLDAPVVSTVHELPFVRNGPIEGFARMLAHRMWLRRDVSTCAAIVVPSTATRDDLLSLHPDAAPRVHVVPHGFDPAPFEEAGPAHPARPAPARPYGLLVGARGPRKGIATWWEARGRLDGALDWWLVGRPDDASAPGLRSDASVQVLDTVEDGGVAPLLAGARLLVYPSRSEGFGFPPLEAMASGVPVVATAAGSIPEVCGDAALLVPPDDAVALADAIRRVATDEALRADLIAKGRVRCRAFPPDRQAALLLGVLRHAVVTGHP